MIMGKIKIFILTVFAFASSSCKVQQRKLEIIGNYREFSFPIKSPNTYSIELQKNNTVKYNYQFEHIGSGQELGTWELKKDTVLLHFKFPQPKIDGKVDVEYGKNKREKIKITVLNRNTNDIEMGSVININGKKHIVAFDDINIEAQYVDVVQIETYGEIYDVNIQRQLDSDVTFYVTNTEYRLPIYDIMVLKWLYKDKTLTDIENKSNKSSRLVVLQKDESKACDENPIFKEVFFIHIKNVEDLIAKEQNESFHNSLKFISRYIQISPLSMFENNGIYPINAFEKDKLSWMKWYEENKCKYIQVLD